MVEPEEREDIRQMMEEDLKHGDVTTESLIEKKAKAKAEIKAGEEGYVAGISESQMVFDELGVESEPKISDGEKVEKGTVIMAVEGKTRGILASERVALNLLSRMSGIATATKEMKERAEKGNPNVKVAATRKTAPLLRRFDKKAVTAVGGDPHRYHLGDFVLIKDNHLKFVDSVAEAVRKAKEAGLSDKIEVEVNSEEEAVSAAEAGADIVMLDNFGVGEARTAVDLLKERNLYNQVTVEASGGIDLSNIKEYASTGVDVISSSYMTMQAPALDIKLDITENL